MNAVVDTNILYYWSGLKPSARISRQKCMLQLQTFQKVYISELSLLEVFTNSENSRDDNKRMLAFIRDRKIPVIKLLSSYKLVKPKDLVYARNTVFDKSFLLNAYKKKVLMEEAFLSATMNGAIAVLATTIYANRLKSDKSRFRTFEKNIEGIIIGNEKLIKSQIKNVLVDYYLTNDEKKLRHSIRDLLLQLLDVVMISYHCVVNGVSIVDMDIGEVRQEKIDQLSRGIANDKLVKRIRKKLTRSEFKPLISDNLLVKYLDAELNALYILTASKVNKNIMRYLILLMRNMFVNDRQFRKNDIIDSLFLEFVPDFQLLTNDSKLCEGLELIDKSQAGINSAFINNIKK
ncbi:hypothetical protein F9K33_12765 [bacterium]|nr:MAG: hypothetical protein F9K33_12765 [bacterium]